jgi:hypothetical protein
MYRWFMAPFKNNDWWIRQNMRSSAGIPDQFFPEFKKSFQDTTEESLLQMLANGLSFRLPAGLERATAPVLVAVGRKEYKEMKISAQLLLAALPNARGVLVSLGPKSSLAQEHNWAMTAPDLFNATVKAWIEDRPLPESLTPLVRTRTNTEESA